MKLRPYPVSLCGNRMEDDQFGFHVDNQGEPVDIEFRCRGGKWICGPRKGHALLNCAVAIKRGEEDRANGKHGWDGNRDEPTITPSIGCDHRCGWHGHITKGEITP